LQLTLRDFKLVLDVFDGALEWHYSAWLELEDMIKGKRWIEYDSLSFARLLAVKLDI
jgi:hypothetical protein